MTDNAPDASGVRRLTTLFSSQETTYEAVDTHHA